MPMVVFPVRVIRSNRSFSIRFAKLVFRSAQALPYASEVFYQHFSNFPHPPIPAIPVSMRLNVEMRGLTPMMTRLNVEMRGLTPMREINLGKTEVGAGCVGWGWV